MIHNFSKMGISLSKLSLEKEQIKLLPSLYIFNKCLDRIIESVYKKSTLTAEAHLEPSRASMMKLFCENS